ncbi:MAG: class A beta-lactamase-related serine hydrolase [Candidatus Omnitrophica bacterium]|nr:class A beta-lactamase-related serine hydrolase [Candidatus Omnitrophota bacterium]
MCKKLLCVIGILLIPVISFGHSFYSKAALFSKKDKAFYTLSHKLEEQISLEKGDFSVFIKDLKYPDFEVAFSEEKKFPAASLIKVPVAAVVLMAIKDGRLFLSQKVTVEKKDITGGSGIIKGMKLPVSLSLEELLKLMIAKSDNTATNKIISILGFDYINKGFNELGLKDTILVRKMMDFYSRKKGLENYTTASELGLIFTQAYEGKLVDEASSAFLVSLLKKQKFNDRLPRYLAKSISVAHKTGLERGVVHDAGIVFSSKGDYVICVLSNKVDDYSQAKKFIAKLSLLTYNFYQ